MKLLGNILIGFAAFIALAGMLAVTGPRMHAWGINVSGSVDPWPVWAVVGVASLAIGIWLRRRVGTAAAGSRG